MQPIVQVDAFTNTPFAGNPAAVCLLSAPRDEAWMQHVAREMNLSETAFVQRLDDGFQLRWFTPAAEVDLCGHATLATAHVLYQDGILPMDQPARFHTRSGVLGACRQGDWIELDFPATPPQACPAPPGLMDALHVQPLYVGKSRFDYLVQVASEAEVRSLAPDFHLLRSLEVRGVMVTAPSDDSRYDFASRFFAPGVGVDEDPVTGSAHCALGPYWGDKLQRTALMARQVSPRGGVLRISLRGERVGLAGQAVTTLRGQLLV